MLRRFLKVTTRFDRVPSNDDNEALLTPSATSLAFPRPDWKSARVAARTAFICSAVYVTLGLYIMLSLKGVHFIEDADDFCLNHINHYSPVVKEVKPSWRTVRFNGSFLHENVYRQGASPEVDAAWAALGTDYRSVIIPVDEAEKTGLRDDQVKISETYGGGFPANVEGLHHLHCLNLLRQALWWNYEYYRDKKEGAFTNSEYIVRYHVTHCLDILRQQLMCVMDVGVLGQVWWQAENMEKPLPFVDFNTKHKCRDFEAIRQWAEEHQLPPEAEVDMSIFYQPPKPGDMISPGVP